MKYTFWISGSIKIESVHLAQFVTRGVLEVAGCLKQSSCVFLGVSQRRRWVQMLRCMPGLEQPADPPPGRTGVRQARASGVAVSRPVAAVCALEGVWVCREQLVSLEVGC